MIENLDVDGYWKSEQSESIKNPHCENLAIKNPEDIQYLTIIETHSPFLGSNTSLNKSLIINDLFGCIFVTIKYIPTRKIARKLSNFEHTFPRKKNRGKREEC